MISSPAIPVETLRTKTTVETDITNALNTYFSRTSRSIGETILHSDIIQECLVDGVSSVDVMLNADTSNILGASDYNREITQDEYAGDSSLEAMLRRVLLEMEAKGTLRKIQPLIDYEKLLDATTGLTQRIWPYGSDVRLTARQFPILGNVVLEEKV